MEWVGGCGGDRSGTGHRTEGAHLLVMGRAVSWRDEEEGGRGVKNKREGGEGQRREREKKEVKTRSVYTKKCSASDSRTG